MNTYKRAAIKRNPNYEIDTNGKVWNITNNEVVDEYVNCCGFSSVVIDGKIHTVAYLMKAAFFTDDPNICIRHKDHDRTNNRLDNLYTFFDGDDFIDNKGVSKTTMIFEIDPETNGVISVWPSVADCVRQLNISKSSMMRALNNNEVAKGRRFEKYNETVDGIGLFDYTDGKHKIKICDIYGNILGYASTLKEAAKQTKVCEQSVYQQLKGYIFESNGYHFEWELSNVEIDVEAEDTVTVQQPAPKKPAYKPKRKNNKRMCQYDGQGNLLNIYQTANAAHQATGILLQQIYKCAGGYGDRLMTGNYVWRYEGDDFNKFPVERKRKTKNCPVVQYKVEANGTLTEVQRWTDIKEAAEALGYKVSTMRTIISRKDTPKGYRYILAKEFE